MADIRCPVCRGQKVMMKLGGLDGECNRCVGNGVIDDSANFSKPVEACDLSVIKSLEKPDRSAMFKKRAKVVI